MSTTVNVTAGHSPYVGPRAYEEGERLYGRDRDISRLTDLLVAERIVLLYSPSGAGKTSLIRAAIVPELRREDFVVLPMIRVTNPLPPALDVARNRYVMSTLLSLEEAQPSESQLPLDVLVTMTLGDYLEQRHAGVDGLVLIFDQFEELLTADSTDVDEKAAFLDQVGAALRDRGRWALFSMREDWIAGLDPFTRAIPTRLANTYRLDLLGEAAARAAITQPAEDAGIHFSEAAATKLVNDLRRVRVQRQDVASEELGPSVEPVQLQVVCSRLWDGLPEGTTEIDESDVEHAGDVDAALAGYYADRVAAAASQTGVSERAIRDWIETALVTEQGFRDQALHGPEVPEGEAARSVAVLRVLEDAHLLRSETGRGAAWYELAHDRLIEPILADNATWRDEHLTPFQRAAAVWDSYKQADNFLLSGDALVEAERWSEDQSTELTQLEQKFITESRDARRVAERDRRVRRRLRLAVVGMAVALCVALVVGVWGWVSAERAGRERDRADQEALIAAIASTAGIADPNPRILLPLRAQELLDADELSLTLRSALYAGLTGTPVDVGFKAGLPIHGVTFTPSGLVAFVREGGATSLWDPANGEHVRDVLSATAGFDETAGVRFSRDGRLVALPDVNSVVSIVDTQSGATRDEFESVEFGVNSFSGDGRSFAYEVDDGVAVARLGANDVQTVPTDVPFALALDRAGTRLVSVGADGQVSLYAVDSPDAVAQTDVPDGGPAIAEFSPADDSFVTSTQTGELIIWDAATGEELQRISGHDGPVLTATYNPAGNVLVTTGSDNQLRVWDLLDGSEIASVPRVVNAETPTRIGFDPRHPDRLVVASAFGAGVMRVPASHAGPVWALAHSANGSRIASAGGDGEVRIWNAEGELLQPLVGSGAVFNTVALNADGSVAAAGDGNGSVYVFDVEGGRTRFTRSTDGAVWSVAIDDEGRYVAAAGEDGVHVWDIVDGNKVADIDAHTGTVLDVAFRPGSGGRELVTASQDQTSVHWHLDERVPVGGQPPPAPAPGPREEGLENAVPDRRDTYRTDESSWFSLAISPDGQRLALGRDNGDVILQDLEGGGAEQEEIELHADAVYDIGFSADGRRLVTTSADGRAIIVDARNGEAIAQIASPTTAFFAAAFDPSGETVTLGGSDGKIYRVPLRDGDLIAAASAVVTRDLEPGECERYLLTECPLE